MEILEKKNIWDKRMIIYLTVRIVIIIWCLKANKMSYPSAKKSIILGVHGQCMTSGAMQSYSGTKLVFSIISMLQSFVQYQCSILIILLELNKNAPSWELHVNINQEKKRNLLNQLKAFNSSSKLILPYYINTLFTMGSGVIYFNSDAMSMNHFDNF